MTDTPHPVDLRVGQALRRERKVAGWSQQRLAEALGVSFQQLQKYESGANRISASKLFEACQALGTRPSVLFGGAEPGEQEGIDDADRSLASRIQSLSPDNKRSVVASVDALRLKQDVA